MTIEKSSVHKSELPHVFNQSINEHCATLDYSLIRSFFQMQLEMYRNLLLSIFKIVCIAEALRICIAPYQSPRICTRRNCLCPKVFTSERKSRRQQMEPAAGGSTEIKTAPTGTAARLLSRALLFCIFCQHQKYPQDLNKITG